MSYTIRAISREEFPRLFETTELSFAEEIPPADTAVWTRIIDPERVFAAFDGEVLAGTGGLFDMVMTVPGNELATGGVTLIGVLPTHRRRGILTAMMRYQMDFLRARNISIAILWASEASIYQRFGFGSATPSLELNLERSRARFVNPSPQVGHTRFVTKDEALDLMPPIYDRVRSETPGMYRRDREWWASHSIYDDVEGNKEDGKLYLAVWEHDGTPGAYASYRVKHDWKDGNPAGTVRLREVMAATPLGYREIWRYVLGIDLIAHIWSQNQPLDSPLQHLLVDQRSLGARVYDGLWLRLVNVQGALEGRGYNDEGRFVLELHDSFCPWNDGSYALEVKGGEGRLTRTAEPAGLTMSAADLGACYLGGPKFTSLVRAGRIVEHHGGVAETADRLFASMIAPYCPEDF
jgi:predicted acetyltransferase